eukprot:10038875-Alexandrium_andersonii.AAC.1
MARRIRAKTDPWSEVVQGITDPRAMRVAWMVVSSYDQEPIFEAASMACFAYQRETAPRCGPHWQIFVQMKSKARSSEVTRALGYPLGKKGEVLGLNSTGHSNRVSCTCSFGPPETAIRYRRTRKRWTRCSTAPCPT